MTKKSKGNMNGKDTSVRNTPIGILVSPMVMGIVVTYMKMENGGILPAIIRNLTYVNCNLLAPYFTLYQHKHNHNKDQSCFYVIILYLIII